MLMDVGEESENGTRLLLVLMRWHLMWSNPTRLQLSRFALQRTQECRGSVASLSPRRLGFSPGLVYVGFVMDEVIIIIIIIIIIYCNWVVTRWQWLFYMCTRHEIGYCGRFYSEYFGLVPVSTIPPVLYAYSSVNDTVCFQQLTASLNNALKKK